jgi:hypothetical protein
MEQFIHMQAPKILIYNEALLIVAALRPPLWYRVKQSWLSLYWRVWFWFHPVDLEELTNASERTQ